MIEFIFNATIELNALTIKTQNKPYLN